MTPAPADAVRLRRLAANTVRGLTMDAVQQANSGHPGMPMGMADAAVVLWTQCLKHNPGDPAWPDRDRFVLSAGHGSTLLYSLLHLTGYDLPLGQLRSFRQWGSLTPGHPEHGLTPGVETTTGPLGQGLANAVGMALAERWLAARFNRPGFEIVDHRAYVIAGDGDLMEGISHEACSLAGHLGLGKLTVLYDDNDISIDGPTALAFGEDVPARFAAYGWRVLSVDGHDGAAVEAALAGARTDVTRPCLIACKTHIGFGSPGRQDTAKAHGEPLGADEVRRAKAQLGLDPDAHFAIPDDALEFMRPAVREGAARQAEWQARFDRYARAHPQLAEAFAVAVRGGLPAGWEAALPALPTDKPLATRAASGAVLDALAPRLPTLIGGSADLTPSNNTRPKSRAPIARDEFSGGYIHFGVREHAMGAILNGLALHGGARPYGGTFLVFSDYLRPAIRMAAMMDLPVMFVFTHDSIGLGEDGPTHQPVEHLTALRAIPNLFVFRPADAAETVAGWRVALRRRGPTALILTRQAVPAVDRARSDSRGGPDRGGYTVAGDEHPDVILVATGSEVHLALTALPLLAGRGLRARVVSMPCMELFDLQPADYRESVLPAGVRARVAVEAGATLGWGRYTGLDGETVGLDRFGASAPQETLFRRLGFTAEAVADAACRAAARAPVPARIIAPQAA